MYVQRISKDMYRLHKIYIQYACIWTIFFTKISLLAFNGKKLLIYICGVTRLTKINRNVPISRFREYLKMVHCRI